MAADLIWMIMPLGSSHGWGVCGKYLSLEMSRLTGVNLVTENLEPEDNNNRQHNKILSQLYTPLDRLKGYLTPHKGYTFHHPALQTIQGTNLRPWFIEVNAPKVVGYTFFERTSLQEKAISAARTYFDWVVAGSTWCEKVLKNCGLRQTATILQGVDTSRFHPGYSEKKRFKDHFVVFSGGKIEFRKGQDLVIRAFKVLQDKYDDVLLVNCWYNMWDSVTATMSMSPHIRFEMPKGDYVNAVSHLLKVNGVNPEKVIVMPPLSNSQMAGIYRDTDCGLFPNRCEGGTNLVLMEYMACGKPAIASNNSGHMDVLSSRHSILLEDQRPLNIMGSDGKLYSSWHDPSLDEVIHCLEWAYENRNEIKKIGLAGSKFMSQMTWEKAAKQFYDLLFHR